MRSTEQKTIARPARAYSAENSLDSKSLSGTGHPAEGLILRHLLRLVILTGEFSERAESDPDYAKIGELAANVCQTVDPSYTDHFLSSDQEAKQLPTVG